ncbi:MAG: hypothetical protein JXB47_14675 [Anaerolineae bacterium]|nr:hypothetical protein [Anaerolineae bacterium]
MNTFLIDLGRDATAARLMAEQLDPYLYQDDLYGSLDPDQPQLTVGGLLLRLHRLHALRSQLTPAQADDLDTAQAALDAARAAWPVHYAEKITREIHARQNSMAWYLDNCDEHAKSIVSAYPVEAEKRTILHHLFAEARTRDIALGDATKQQAALDARLHRHVAEAGFIWPEAVQPAYPPDPFWWLHSWPEPDL